MLLANYLIFLGLQKIDTKVASRLLTLLTGAVKTRALAATTPLATLQLGETMTDIKTLRAAADKATAKHEAMRKNASATPEKRNAAWQAMLDARHNYRAAVRVIENARLEKIANGTWL